jgi:spermidine synthase
MIVTMMLAYVPTRERRIRSAAEFSMGATGFTLMALQIFLLLAFQSIYGFVYSQLAILIALFMAGITFGSWLAMRSTRRDDRFTCRAVVFTQFLLALSVPVLMLLVSLLAKASGVDANWLGAQCAFPALAALCGILGGYQFPLVNAMVSDVGGSRQGLGLLYAIDLLGGCAGALVLSGYIIPVFGFWRTAWLCAAVNLAPVLLAARACNESHSSRNGSKSSFFDFAALRSE